MINIRNKDGSLAQNIEATKLKRNSCDKIHRIYIFYFYIQHFVKKLPCKKRILFHQRKSIMTDRMKKSLGSFYWMDTSEAIKYNDKEIFINLLHLKGLSLWWHRECDCRFDNWLNAFSHPWNLHLYGFSPVCVRICCCRCESCVNWNKRSLIKANKYKSLIKVLF